MKSTPNHYSGHRFVAISSGGGLFGTPLVKVILQHLRRDERVRRIELMDVYYEGQILDLAGEKTEVHWLHRYKSYKQKRSPTLFAKISKYIRIIHHVTHRILFQDNIIFYSTGHLEIVIIAFLKWLTRSRSKLIYHQFEVYSFSSRISARWCQWCLARLAGQIDFVVLPERARALYLSEAVPDLAVKISVCPNTTRTGTTLWKPRSDKSRIRLLHVGSTGEGTYWREIVDYVKADKELVSELAFVGHSFEGLKLYVDTLCDPRIKCLPTVPHGELNELYSSYDVGLILYKPIDLNTELAAPNKLYEFWANGLPVLAPKLSGLCSQIDNPVFGVMVDLRSSADVTNALTRFRDNLNGPVSRKDLQNIFAARWDQTHFVTPLVESWLS